MSERYRNIYNNMSDEERLIYERKHIMYELRVTWFKNSKVYTVSEQKYDEELHDWFDVDDVINCRKLYSLNEVRMFFDVALGYGNWYVFNIYKFHSEKYDRRIRKEYYITIINDFR